MRFHRFAALFAALTLATTSAQSTSLEGTGGAVRLNQGDGFKPVSGSTRVQPGDRVLIDGTGEGTLLFTDGCALPVQGGSVLTVPEVSPCALSAQFPAAEAAAAGSFGGLGGFGGVAGLAGIAGIAGVAGAAVAGTAVATGKSSASQQTNQQNQLIEAAVLARPGPASP